MPYDDLAYNAFGYSDRNPDATVASRVLPDTLTYAGRGLGAEIAVYPLWDGPSYKGGSPIAAPSTVGEIGAPVNGGALGAISFGPNASVGGTIVDDESFDVYGISLVAGETYTFSAYGSGANALEDTVLFMFDEAGQFVEYDDDGGHGRMSLYTYTAQATGTHFVAVSNFPGLGDLSGDYTLDVTVKPATDVVGDPITGGPVELISEGITYGFIDGDGPNYLAGFLGEIDSYAIVVEAGKIYSFEVSGGADYRSDPFALTDNELDPVITLFDSNGNLVGLSDDISFPGDVNSRLSFYAEESGTYYLDVMSYDPWTGGFSINVETFDPADFNPVDSINWFSADNVDFGPDGVAYVYFGDSDENFGQTADDGISPMITFDWNDYEKQQVMAALEEYEKILGVEYEITDDVDMATFRLLKAESAQYGAYFFPQDPGFGGNQGVGVFNILSGGWSFDEQQSLEQGGFSFSVILHEFGHAHGLAHPHDTGGGSEVMLGVTASTESLGLYDLNQGVYTVMSYNSAWQLHPDGPSPYTGATVDRGFEGTLSAFDIAALQQRYGANNPNNETDTVYMLDGENARGTYYETIWDTGGEDTIRFDGLKDVQIDLMAATLDYSPTGGGVVSFVDGIWGGFTIANGVEIENARGGSGDDVILGNELGNTLEGRNGNDAMMGRDGNDTMYGGNGTDNMDGGDGNDRVYGQNGDDVVNGGAGDDTVQGDRGDDIVNGGEGNDELSGGKGADIFEFTDLGGVDEITDFKNGPDMIDVSALGVNAFIGADAFNGVAGELRAFDSGSGYTVEGDVDGDGVSDFSILVNTSVDAGDFILA